MAAKRWEIKIGAPVEASDGPLGRVQQVVLNPGDQRVAALVVRRGVLFGQDIVVPIEAVDEATDKLIRLRLSSDQLRSQPVFQPADYLSFTTTIEGYEPGQAVFSLLGQVCGKAQAGHGAMAEPGAVIRAGQRVECRDGYTGKVDRVLLDERSGRATHFVIRKGVLRSKDIMAPVEWVSEFQPDHLKLAVDRAALEQLPEYLPDEEIEWAIEQALWEDELIRHGVLAYTPIEIAVQDGIVTLRGHVNTSVERQRIEEITQAVRGVQGLENHLVLDYEVEVAVAQALGRDSRTRDHIVQVSSRFGYVFLQGQVPSKEIQMAAEEIAATVPQVRGVINRLRMSRKRAPKTALRVVEPRIGQDVYAVNIYIGQVYKVVISPRSRRVSAVIVRGKLLDPQQADPKQLLEAWPQPERAVVVPAEHVGHVSISVFLTLTPAEYARLPDFNPADFTPPDDAWEPPFPYHREEVLLDLGHSKEASYEACRCGVVMAEHDHVETPAGQPVELLPIRRGQTVRYRRGEVGTVAHVLLESGTGRVSHIVVRAGPGLAKDTLIPVAWVSCIEPDHIFVDVAAEQLAALPGYQAPESDANLQAEIEQKAMTIPAMAENQAAVTIEVQQGAVRLQGRVPSDADRCALNHLARATQGVWDVEDNLVSDESLERATTHYLRFTREVLYDS